MRAKSKHGWYLTVLITLPSHAEVMTDGSVGKIQNLSGQMTIPQNLGTTVGRNLFHSFKTFNVNVGESATFTGADNLKNVISRVTGGEISRINGTLKSEVGKANFYFINPAGVTFGKNAQLDVPAAFHLSTADYVKFSEASFYANLTQTSTFSAAEPKAFGFLGNLPTRITVRNHASLATQNTGAISVVAGDITLNSGTITTEGGTIRIGALGQTDAQVGFTGKLTPGTGSLKVVNNGSINSSSVDTTNAGTIAVSAGDILLKNPAADSSNTDTATQNLFALHQNPTIGSSTSSTGSAGRVSVKATQSLTATHSASISSVTYSSGAAGNVIVKTANLVLSNNAKIIASANKDSTGQAGLVSVTANQSLTAANLASINSSAFGRGKAGNVIVKTPALTLDSGAEISALAGKESQGETGLIRLKAQTAILSNGGKITVQNDGNAVDASKITPRNLRVEVADLTLNGGLITATTSGNVAADTIWLNVDQLKMTAGSQIQTDAQAGSLGKAGIVIVKSTGAIEMVNGSLINSSVYGTGAAGSVTIQAPVISVSGSTISAEAGENANGETGNVTVRASQALSLIDHSKITIQNGAVVKDSSNIAVGAIKIRAPEIVLKESLVTAESRGNINAGRIVTQFSHQLIMDATLMTTSTQDSDGGNITVKGGELINLKNAVFGTSIIGSFSAPPGSAESTSPQAISSNAAKGNGGNIQVTADVLVINTGLIQANALSGNGGNIRLNLKALIPSYDSLIQGGSQVLWQPSSNVIQASSVDGVSGDINLTSPKFNISGSIMGLKSTQLSVPNLDRGFCTGSLYQANSLVRRGKGGLIANEEKSGFVPPVIIPALQTATFEIEENNSSLDINHQPCSSL